ncbi:NAD-dependent epimerase/dehydratase family protein [Chryseobacterium sp. TY3]
MKISIIGASGFIGQNLLKSLSSSHDVKAVSLRNINWKTLVQGGDVFINLVGKAHDHKGTATEADYFYANLDLAKEVFNEFVTSDAKLLIHISSLAAIEEFESDNPLSEDHKANPQSFYGKSKRIAEEWLLEQNLPSNKKIIILRPPMVHGPGDKGNLWLLHKLISKGIPYPLTSFDNQRSFISIDNFSFFIKEIIEKQDLLLSGIYHISDDEVLSTKQIIEIIKKVENKKVMNLGIPKTIVKGLAKVGDVIPIPLNTKRLKKMTSNLTLSNEKIKSTLGVGKLPISAQQGLELTIISFRKR